MLTYVVIPYFAQTHHSVIRMPESQDDGEFVGHAAVSFVEFAPLASNFFEMGLETSATQLLAPYQELYSSGRAAVQPADVKWTHSMLGIVIALDSQIRIALSCSGFEYLHWLKKSVSQASL